MHGNDIGRHNPRVGRIHNITWDQPKDTKKAIEDLKITWPQILNAQNTPSELYGFNGIPWNLYGTVNLRKVLHLESMKKNSTIALPVTMRMK